MPSPLNNPSGTSRCKTCIGPVGAVQAVASTSVADRLQATKRSEWETLSDVPSRRTVTDTAPSASTTLASCSRSLSPSFRSALAWNANGASLGFRGVLPRTPPAGGDVGATSPGAAARVDRDAVAPDVVGRPRGDGSPAEPYCRTIRTRTTTPRASAPPRTRGFRFRSALAPSNCSTKDGCEVAGFDVGVVGAGGAAVGVEGPPGPGGAGRRVRSGPSAIVRSVTTAFTGASGASRNSSRLKAFGGALCQRAREHRSHHSDPAR